MGTLITGPSIESPSAVFASRHAPPRQQGLGFRHPPSVRDPGVALRGPTHPTTRGEARQEGLIEKDAPTLLILSTFFPWFGANSRADAGHASYLGDGRDRERTKGCRRVRSRPPAALSRQPCERTRAKAPRVLRRRRAAGGGKFAVAGPELEDDVVVTDMRLRFASARCSRG